MEKKAALVLSGGSIRGAFQVGAIKAFIENDYVFESIYGISVGSLNGAFLTNEAGSQKNKSPEDDLDWKSIGKNLVSFWSDNIKTPNDVIYIRKRIKLFSSIIRKKFNGLVDTKPIYDLVKKTITMKDLQDSPIKLTVGCVNVMNGTMVYAQPKDQNFIDYLLASTAIPIMMPIVNIGGDKNRSYFDGGIRDVAPLKKAIEQGAKEIVCIACQSEKLEGVNFNCGNLISLADRIMDIVINEIVNSEIEWAEHFNKYLPTNEETEEQGSLAGYRKIKLTVVRPLSPIMLDIEDFKSDQIEETINLGYKTANAIINK